MPAAVESIGDVSERCGSVYALGDGLIKGLLGRHTAPHFGAAQ
jgi:hypothetical protein